MYAIRSYYDGGCADADARDDAGGIVQGDHVTHSDGAFEQQNDAADEIGDDSYNFV